MPARLAVNVAIALLAASMLAGCTASGDPTDPAPTASAPLDGTGTEAPVGPAGPGPSATECLPEATVTAITGLAVTTTRVTAPPAGPVDALLPGITRQLCVYDLSGGQRLGFTPLVDVPNAAQSVTDTMNQLVNLDECTLASGYWNRAPVVTPTYYVWTGTSFAAAYLLIGDPTDPNDPQAWLPQMIDAVGLCTTLDT